MNADIHRDQSVARNPEGSIAPIVADVVSATTSTLPETSDVRDYITRCLRLLAPKLPTLQSDHTAISVPPAFNNLLGQPNERALAWEALSAGVLKRLKPEERLVLIQALMPYVATDYPSNASGITEMANSLSKKQNGDLYRCLGESLLNVPLAQRDILRLTDPFLRELCPNLEFEPNLKPWTQLFANKGGAVTHLKLLNELMQRLDQGHLSSYDHILQVILLSREESVHEFLKTIVSPHDPEPYRVTLLDFAANTVRNTLKVAPITLTGSLLIGGLDSLATFMPYLVTAGIVAMKNLAQERIFLQS